MFGTAAGRRRLTMMVVALVLAAASIPTWRVGGVRAEATLPLDWDLPVYDIDPDDEGYGTTYNARVHTHDLTGTSLLAQPSPSGDVRLVPIAADGTFGASVDHFGLLRKPLDEIFDVATVADSGRFVLLIGPGRPGDADSSSHSYLVTVEADGTLVGEVDVPELTSGDVLIEHLSGDEYLVVYPEIGIATRWTRWGTLALDGTLEVEPGTLGNTGPIALEVVGDEFRLETGVAPQRSLVRREVATGTSLGSVGGGRGRFNVDGSVAVTVGYAGPQEDELRIHLQDGSIESLLDLSGLRLLSVDFDAALDHFVALVHDPSTGIVVVHRWDDLGELQWRGSAPVGSAFDNASTLAGGSSSGSTHWVRRSGEVTILRSFATGTNPPSRPVSVRVASGWPDADVMVVRWDPPANGGDTVVTHYTVTASPGGHQFVVPAPIRSVSIGGLSPDQTYNVTVRAVNAAGSGVPRFASHHTWAPQEIGTLTQEDTYEGHAHAPAWVADAGQDIVGRSRVPGNPLGSPGFRLDHELNHVGDDVAPSINGGEGSVAGSHDVGGGRRLLAVREAGLPTTAADAVVVDGEDVISQVRLQNGSAIGVSEVFPLENNRYLVTVTDRTGTFPFVDYTIDAYVLDANGQIVHSERVADQFSLLTDPPVTEAACTDGSCVVVNHHGAGSQNQPHLYTFSASGDLQLERVITWPSGLDRTDGAQSRVSALHRLPDGDLLVAVDPQPSTGMFLLRIGDQVEVVLDAPQMRGSDILVASHGFYLVAELAPSYDDRTLVLTHFTLDGTAIRTLSAPYDVAVATGNGVEASHLLSDELVLTVAFHTDLRTWSVPAYSPPTTTTTTTTTTAPSTTTTAPPTTTTTTTTTAPPTTTTTAPPTTVPPTTPPPSPPGGYWMLGGGGAVHSFGDVEHHGDAPAGTDAIKLVANIDGAGYWVLDRSGRVYAFGSADHHGDMRNASFSLPAGEEASTMSAMPDGSGYWIFTNRGRAVAFGAAQHYGDVSHLELNGPVIDSISTPSGRGYWQLGSDGGIFASGDAAFHGSIQSYLDGTGAQIAANDWLNAPIVAIVANPEGGGYWLVASDGGTFSFGATPYRGSVPAVLPVGAALARPINGMVAYGNGYLMVGSDGGVFNFSDLGFFGSLGGDVLAYDIVALAATGNT